MTRLLQQLALHLNHMRYAVAIDCLISRHKQQESRSRYRVSSAMREYSKALEIALKTAIEGGYCELRAGKKII